MNDNSNIKKAGGPGLLTFTLLWGIVTQCLQLGGIISWPWFAIWGPVLINLAIIVVLLLIICATLAIAWFAEK